MNESVFLVAIEWKVDPTLFLEWLIEEGFVDKTNRSIASPITNGTIETVRRGFEKTWPTFIEQKHRAGKPNGTYRNRVTYRELLGSAEKRVRFSNADWLGAPKKGQSLRSPNADFGDRML